jgi:hypothetical protein
MLTLLIAEVVVATADPLWRTHPAASALGRSSRSTRIFRRETDGRQLAVTEANRTGSDRTEEDQNRERTAVILRV